MAKLLPFLKAHRYEQPHIFAGYSNRVSLRPADKATKTAEFLERVPMEDFVDAIKSHMRALSILEKAATDAIMRSLATHITAELSTNE